MVQIWLSRGLCVRSLTHKKLVLGVRQAVAKMEVVIASWIRVTAALEVVPVALPIPEALARAAIAVV